MFFFLKVWLLPKVLSLPPPLPQTFKTKDCKTTGLEGPTLRISLRPHPGAGGLFASWEKELEPCQSWGGEVGRTHPFRFQWVSHPLCQPCCDCVGISKRGWGLTCNKLETQCISQSPWCCVCVRTPLAWDSLGYFCYLYRGWEGHPPGLGTTNCGLLLPWLWRGEAQKWAVIALGLASATL